MNSAKKIPSPLVSLFPIAFLVGMLFATIHTFGSDALSGGSQISLLATTGMCVFIGMAFYRIPWKDYELAITNNISGVATAIIILLIIGALSGTWMISGVVPTLIYYGMQIIHPNFFLTSTCIICALVSIIRKSKFPQNPKRSVRFSGKRTKRSVQKRKARNTQKAETKVL